MLVLVFVSLQRINAQQAVLTSGGDVSGAGGFVAYSLGQTGFTNFSSEDGSISIGVQQPNVVIMVGTEDPDIILSASVFPNPVISTTQLTMEGQMQQADLMDLSFNLYDISGELLLRREIVSTTTSISMESLSSGLYFLKITRKETEIKTFKIFKTN